MGVSFLLRTDHQPSRWVRMHHPPIPYHVDVPQPGTLKRKIDFALSDEELDVDSVGDDHGLSLSLSLISC